MDPNIYRDLGEHKAQLDTLVRLTGEIQEELKSLPEILSELKAIKGGGCPFGVSVGKKVTACEAKFDTHLPTLADLQKVRTRGTQIFAIFGVLVLFLGLVSANVAARLGDVVEKLKTIAGFVK